MSKILYADFARLFKLKIFYCGLILSAVVAIIFDLVNTEEKMFVGTPEAGPLYLLPMLIAAALCLCIGPEFTNGAVRNKIIIGHSRKNIFCSWAITFSFVAVIYFIAYEATAFIGALALGFDLSVFEADNISVNLLLCICLLVSNMFFSLFICVLVSDSKSIAVLFLLQEPPMIVSTMLFELYPDSKLLDFAGRFFPQSQTNVLNIALMPDKPWLTVICTLSVTLLMFFAGLAYFEKKDLK